jgi:hypothetical protein
MEVSLVVKSWQELIEEISDPGFPEGVRKAAGVAQ